MQAGFVSGLNLILLVGASVALAAAIASLLLIRGRDFVTEPVAHDAVNDTSLTAAQPADAMTS